MSSALPLRAALKQGALVTIANWPAVLVEFGMGALNDLALGVPVLGGAFMVAVLLGVDVTALLGQGVRETAGLIYESLAAAPVALAAFLIAFGIVFAGGLILSAVVRAGTLAVLVASERAVPDLHRLPTHVTLLRRASRWSLAAVFGGVQRYGRRVASLAAWLCLVYLVIGGLTIGPIPAGVLMAAASAWPRVWLLLVVLVASAGVLGVALASLLFDLALVIVVTDDCSAAEALRRMRRFVVTDARQVIGIVSVTRVALLVAAVAWLVATANVAFIGFVPVVGLLVAPLQAALWIVRGVLFQALALSTLAAYQTQYRRFHEPGAASAPAAFGGQRA